MRPHAHSEKKRRARRERRVGKREREHAKRGNLWDDGKRAFRPMDVSIHSVNPIRGGVEGQGCFSDVRDPRSPKISKKGQYENCSHFWDAFVFFCLKNVKTYFEPCSYI